MAIQTATLQMRRGLLKDFDPNKMVPGEWAVSIDPQTSNQIVWMCFKAGVVKRLGTYEDFESQIAEITNDIRESLEDTFNEIRAYMEQLKDASDSADSAAKDAEKAKASASESKDYSLWSKSYAVGEGDMRPEESVDNAKYYYEQARRISTGLSGALIPMGTISFSELSNQTKQPGYMYNISDPFVSDSTFKDGAGHSYAAGTNVYYTEDGYWDCLAGMMVSGVKGGAENGYRVGNVNITAANIGLGNVDNTADGNKNVLSAKYLKGDHVALSGKTLIDLRNLLDNIAVQAANNAILGTVRVNAGNWITLWNTNDETTPIVAGYSYTFTLIASYVDKDYSVWLVSTYSENDNYIIVKRDGNWGQINKIGLEKNFPKVPGLASNTANGLLRQLDNNTAHFLRGDGTWQTPPTGSNYGVATSSSNGLMSKEDKAKLDKFGDGYVVVGKKSGITLGSCATAEGYNTTASSGYSHAEGYNTTASNIHAHAEGWGTTASGESSHAEGDSSTASGYYSHAEGYNTTASNMASHACGKLNKAMGGGGAIGNKTGDAFSIGNGTPDSISGRSNAFRVTYAGAAMGLQGFGSSGADYAEFIKPWHDDNIDGEDRVGYFVTVKDGKLYKAKEGDYIIGITSGNPSVIGNADEDYYWRWERDEFNRIVKVDVPELVEKKDEDGNVVIDEGTGLPVMEETGNIIKDGDFKQSPDYDPSQKYIERKDRPEWDYVGMLGVIPVRDDGTCIVDGYCRCGGDGVATYASERGLDTYMVLERVSDYVVKVVLR